MEKKKIALAAVAATAIALSSGQSAFAEENSLGAYEEKIENILEIPTVYNSNLKIVEVTKEGITVKLPDELQDKMAKPITILNPKGNKMILDDTMPTIPNDKIVTYKFKTSLSEMLYGYWAVEGDSIIIEEPAVYEGLKVIEVTKKDVTVELKNVVTNDNIQQIKVKNPNGINVLLSDKPTIDNTGKKVTYTFNDPLENFLTGKWIIDTVEYNATLPKVSAYEGLKVLKIAKEGVTLQLPSIVSTGKAEQISIKDPSGIELELGDLPTIGADKTVTYKFKTTPNAIATGTWTVNTDIKFKVLSEDANKAKVKAAQNKIKKAMLTLSTNKNYVKYVLAAKEAVEALTYEQKELFAKETVYNQAKLSVLEKTIEAKYKPVQEFETAVKNLDSTATGFVTSVEAAETKYNALTKEQLSYVDAKIKKQYTAYLNEAAVKKGLAFKAEDLTSKVKASDIIDFNKAYKKLSATQKETLLLVDDTKKTIEALTDKTLQKNASAALTVQKKFANLEVQKKNDKNKKLYYTLDEYGKPTKTETTTKTSEPVMVPSLSAVTKAQSALAALQKKNEVAYSLVDQSMLKKVLEKDSTVAGSIKKGSEFNTAVTAVAQATNFVEAFNKAKAAYIALTPDEQKYAIDKNALKQYKAYLKIDKVAVMYDKMDDPEASTKSMKLAYTAKGDITSITNDVKFSKGKFTIPKGNYKFEFKDGSDSKSAYYKDGVWTVGAVPSLGATPVTAQEVVAYAKAFNALKDDQEKLLLTSNTATVKYNAYVGKEDDYKKAAAVEKKIATAVKSKKAKSIETAKKALGALTTAQKGYVSNKVELESLSK